MKLKNKLFRCISMLITLVLIVSIIPVGALAADSASIDVEALRNELVNYYRQNKQNIDSWWEIAALKGADEDINSSHWVLTEWESSDLRANAQSASFAAYILGFIARGEDPQIVWEGRNIVQELVDKQREDGSFGIINDQVWSIIALDAIGASYNIEKAIDWLVSQQKTDGGFAFSGDVGDPDITGMALIALSNHKDNVKAKESLDKAVIFLKNAQKESAGFVSWGVENSNSLASVISGLVAAGEDVLAEKWSKNNKSILQALMDYQVEDNSYSYLLDPKTSDAIATCQVLIALGDIVAGESIWKRLELIDEDTQVDKVNVRVEGIEKNILHEDVLLSSDKEETALDVLKKVLDKNKIEYEIQSGSFGDFIKNINGDESGKFGGYDGWLYLVNGEMAPVGVGEYKVLPGDELVIYYGMFTPDTLVPIVSISPEKPMPGEALTVTVSSSYYDWSTEKMVDVKIKDARVSINNKNYLTDENGVVVIKGINLPGEYQLKVSKENENSYPSIVRTGAINVTYEGYKLYSDFESISGWALEYVQKARKLNLMEGTNAVTNTFSPKNDITRAEFTAVILRLLGEKPLESSKTIFKDVGANKWYFGYIMRAKEKGLVEGISEDMFAPDRAITRQEMAAMIARALNLTEDSKGEEIKDFNEVSSWAKSSVAAVYNKGIMIGFEGVFDPEGKASREMAAVVSVKLHDIE